MLHRHVMLTQFCPETLENMRRHTISAEDFQES
jgi:hypothetical protein